MTNTSLTPQAIELAQSVAISSWSMSNECKWSKIGQAKTWNPDGCYEIVGRLVIEGYWQRQIDQSLDIVE